MRLQPLSRISPRIRTVLPYHFSLQLTVLDANLKARCAHHLRVTISHVSICDIGMISFLYLHIRLFTNTVSIPAIRRNIATAARTTPGFTAACSSRHPTPAALEPAEGLCMVPDRGDSLIRHRLCAIAVANLAPCHSSGFTEQRNGIGASGGGEISYHDDAASKAEATQPARSLKLSAFLLLVFPSLFLRVTSNDEPSCLLRICAGPPHLECS
ncbi:hypothetical protein MAPG_03577 [Magnaporthiopsis poae ATCC 64411]|uniref:Uncharacterized protein n=1 Tax=Magnaporthiopsis poae (strain ATCC 64411 / 73-15) TaxID=644358 RepID=A0A0C4DUD7_MAGP6|nr:hypothetical protein MAPG_03577 [Magnaporthiopsis poae ATCC 64411]